MLLEQQPDAVISYGDTNSALAGALNGRTASKIVTAMVKGDCSICGVAEDLA